MILLSFDTEEFDVPREHGVDISMEESMRVSVFGTNRILDCLQTNGVKATFFCTGNFAEQAPRVIQRILDEGHEVACHGVDHWRPQSDDVFRSKEIVERISGVTAQGYRQPRMFPVSDDDIERAGFRYNSSLNPAFIPGRYAHLNAPRTYFMKNGVMQIPASVTPCIRFPLFWLSLHNLPEALYHAMVWRVLRHDLRQDSNPRAPMLLHRADSRKNSQPSAPAWETANHTSQAPRANGMAIHARMKGERGLKCHC